MNIIPITPQTFECKFREIIIAEIIENMRPLGYVVKSGEIQTIKEACRAAEYAAAIMTADGFEPSERLLQFAMSAHDTEDEIAS